MMYCELHGCEYIEQVLPRGTNKLKYPFTCKHGLSFDPLLTYILQILLLCEYKKQVLTRGPSYKLFCLYK